MSRSHESRWEAVCRMLLLAGAAVVPVAISLAGDDHFRLPKQLLMYAVVLCATAIAGMAFVLRRMGLDGATLRELRVPFLLGAAAICWGVITTAASTHRPLSIQGLIWGTSVILLFLLASVTLHRASLALTVAAVLLPAVVNSVIVLLQATSVWNPWVFPEHTAVRMMKNALLGNPDDVGVYLAPAVIVAASAFVVTTSLRARVTVGLAALVIVGGILATETLTALAGIGVALLLFVVVWRGRSGVAVAAVTLACLLAALLVYHPTRVRLGGVAKNLEQRRWNHVITGRVVPFAMAWEMFTDRPLVGMGPGTFKFHYMRYRIQARENRPDLFAGIEGPVFNFGEVHNDHLQVLAETGLPGYLLLLAGIVFVAVRSRAPGTGARTRFAALAGIPLAVLLLVTMITQFALQLAAPAFTYAFLGGACVAWKRAADGP